MAVAATSSRWTGSRASEDHSGAFKFKPVSWNPKADVPLGAIVRSHGVRRDPQRTGADAVEIRLPDSLIGKPRLLMCGQLADDWRRNGSPPHIIQSGFVDDVVGVAGTQHACHPT